MLNEQKAISNNIPTGFLHSDLDPVKTIVLVYPQDVVEPYKYGADADYTHLTPIYDQLIRCIPHDVEVLMLVKNALIGERIKKLHRKLRYKVVNDLQTIWMRDIIGFPVGDKIIKPVYNPEYYEGMSTFAKSVHHQMNLVPSILGKEIEPLDLIWDGGNLVSDGKVGFITDRIFKDNNKTKETIINAISKKVNIKPVIIPALDDDCGHSDGFMAFADKETILLSVYPPGFEDDSNKLDEIEMIIRNEGYKVERIEEYPTRKRKREFDSAVGIYVNFLNINGNIIMPTYKGHDHKKQLRQLMQFGPVSTIDCTDLAEYGGVLHCISWTC